MTFDWSAFAYVEVDEYVVCVRKIKNGKIIGKWHLPGGKRNSLEFDVRQTLIRELKEETGIEVCLNQVPRAAHRQPRVIRKDRGNDKSYAHRYDDYFFSIKPTTQQLESLFDASADEEVALLPLSEVLSGPSFKMYHRKVIEAHFRN